MSVSLTAKLQFKIILDMRRYTSVLDVCFGFGMYIGGCLTRVNKQAEVGERKKINICNEFIPGVKVQFGVSWVLSLLH